MEEPNHLTSQGPWLQMPSQRRLGFQHMKIRGKQTFSPLHGSYSNSIFNFFGSYHTVLHSGYTILLSYQQCTRVFIFPYPGQQLLFSGVFFGSSHPRGCNVLSYCDSDLRFPDK